ncbi:hypothetical protein GYMLUDRAFT_49705 [Collybiopsis luxurians FD-317 M1]|uniref:protein-histidine N-methyltransferase n=1 Tax=Collybiopsis luxurians FD-317 M1 TaxID=944289 RepID=A0A0D0AR65_9AGAR|nr:hypothetical protein GYMLUDRAFT_49705 [Collybiopsis luxurians FD-317 M1]
MFVELNIDHLLSALPTQISFSPLEIPISSPSSDQKYYISRRDLFDARFQVISEDKGSPEAIESTATDPRLQFLDTPSDLVPGVYEGGLKTWECSVDLVDHLSEILTEGGLEGKRVLELGCGTGVPSIYLLHKIFTSPPTSRLKTAIHVQDYNPSALELVTFPNAVLAWYMSPASAPFLSSQRSSTDSAFEEDDTADPLEYPEPNPNSTGDLPITPALRDAFFKSLQEYGVEIKFFGGSWKNFQDQILDSNDASRGDLGRYDIVLTSETIYRTENVPDLIDVIWSATHPPPSVDSSSERLSKMSISQTISSHSPLILVAAKVFYFGVGGGMDDFIQAVKSWKGRDGSEQHKDAEVDIVWEKKTGVGRKIARVIW